MIVDERMVTYINSLDKGNIRFLNDLEQEALKNHVPIIRREMQSFLKVLLQNKSSGKDFRSRYCSRFFHTFHVYLFSKKM